MRTTPLMNGMPIPRQARANEAFMSILIPQASRATARTVKTALIARQTMPARLKAVSELVLVFIVEILSVGCSSFDNQDIRGCSPFCIYELTSSQTEHNHAKNMNCPLAIGSRSSSTYLICSGGASSFSPGVSFPPSRFASRSITSRGRASRYGRAFSRLVSLALSPCPIAAIVVSHHRRNHRTSPHIHRLPASSTSSNARTGNRKTENEGGMGDERDDKAKTRTQIPNNQSSHHIFARPPPASSSSPAALK